MYKGYYKGFGIENIKTHSFSPSKKIENASFMRYDSIFFNIGHLYYRCVSIKPTTYLIFGTHIKILRIITFCF